MARAFLFESEHTDKALTDFQILQLTRPTYKTVFVGQGDNTHLLVYLNRDHDLPFVRVPCEVLLAAVKAYESTQ